MEVMKMFLRSFPSYGSLYSEHRSMATQFIIKNIQRFKSRYPSTINCQERVGNSPLYNFPCKSITISWCCIKIKASNWKFWNFWENFTSLLGVKAFKNVFMGSSFNFRSKWSTLKEVNYFLARQLCNHTLKKKLALKGNKFYGIKMCSQYSLEKTKM